MKKFIFKLFVIYCAGMIACVFWLEKAREFYPEHRILAITYSFKRPIFISGQVFRMRNQDYSNFKYSVSVKGVPDSAARHMLLREWQPFIDEGWLHVRFDTNKTQYSNFMDTVRGFDLDEFDYVCKIDDDDWYAPDYLKNVNRSLYEKPNATISFTNRAMTLTENIKTTVFDRNYSLLSGPTMCYRSDVVKALLSIEKNPKNVKKYIPDMDIYWYEDLREDNLFHQIARAMGEMHERKTDWWQVIFGWQYRSVIRGGYVDTSTMDRSYTTTLKKKVKKDKKTSESLEKPIWKRLFF